MTAPIIDALKQLKATEKFNSEGFYPGAPNESLRIEAQRVVNELLERLLASGAATSDKQFVLREFSQALDSFTQTDTEERERMCGYLEEIMDIVGIESSDGLLNTWMYGFDPVGEGTPLEPEVERSIEQVWSDLDLQVYGHIENQLAGAESRRDALLGLPRQLQVFYLSLIVEAEAVNGGLRQFLVNLSEYADLIAPALRDLPCEPAALIFEQALAEWTAHRGLSPDLDHRFRAEAAGFSRLRQDLPG